MEVDPLEMVENDESAGAGEEKKSRLNNLVAVSVALLATFMGLCQGKSGNVSQAMEQQQATALDQWNFSQARNIRQEIAEATASLLKVQLLAATPDQKPAITAELTSYTALIAEYHAKKADNKKQAEEAQVAYDELNLHDDQFDLSDAMLAIAISLMALTSLTQKRWLYYLALVPTAIGVIMGLAGLFGWHIHSDLAARLLGT